MRRAIAVGAVAAIAVAACMTQEEEACHDVAGWIGDLVHRCVLEDGGSASYADEQRELMIELFEDQFACEDVEAIRDRQQLYGACREQIAAFPCDQIGGDWLPDPCRSQLLL